MITHGSTFSGIGAPEVAAEMLGWENVFHCEINPFGRKVLDYYFPKAKSYEDITRTDFSEWRDRISVLTGGFPCQPFSFFYLKDKEKMEKETFQRAIEINQRLKDLNDILNEISPKQAHRLNYVDKDNKGCTEWRMKHIGDLLDKHDEMIRAEIMQEINNLHAEIETL